MRVVDDHRERLALIDGLEAAGHASNVLDAARDLLVADAEQARGRNCGKHVLDVEPAAQVDLHGQVLGTKRGVLREPERERVAELVREFPSPRVVDVHRGARTRLAEEEPPLRLEVALLRLVEVEMVVAEIREREGREPHAVEAAELRAVRRRLRGA